MKQTFWTPERVARLRALHAEGQSALQIQQALQAPTRNMICGAIYRYIVKGAQREANLRQRAERAAARNAEQVGSRMRRQWSDPEWAARQRAKISVAMLNSDRVAEAAANRRGQRGTRAFQEKSRAATLKSCARGNAVVAQAQRERALAAAIRKPGGVYQPKFLIAP